jgi:hypothetical protein
MTAPPTSPSPPTPRARRYRAPGGWAVPPRTALALVVALALALAAAALVPAPPTRAEVAITVIASTARVSFPAGVTFTLEAASDAEITGVALLLDTPTQRYGGYVRTVRPDFRPGTRVTATWTWRRFGTNLPPGAEIAYRWRIADAAGAEIETPAASVVVEDSRFSWRELRDGPLTLRWHKGDDDFGRELLSTATEAVARLGREQGVDLQTPVTIYVYADQGELFGALPGLPGWVGGVSLGEFDTVLVAVSPTDRAAGRRALVHELTHQLIYQITFNPSLGSRVPAWLNEGLAVVSEGPTSDLNRRLLAAAAANGTLPTLRSLGTPFAGLPAQQAQLAYAAAEDVVRHLLVTEGAERMRALLAQFREGRTADDALRAVYGRGVDETEDGWRRSLGLRPIDRSGAGATPTARPTPAPGDTARWVVGGGVAAILLVLLGALGGGWWALARRGHRAG